VFLDPCRESPASLGRALLACLSAAASLRCAAGADAAGPRGLPLLPRRVDPPSALFPFPLLLLLLLEGIVAARETALVPRASVCQSIRPRS